MGEVNFAKLNVARIVYGDRWHFRDPRIENGCTDPGAEAAVTQVKSSRVESSREIQSLVLSRTLPPACD